MVRSRWTWTREHLLGGFSLVLVLAIPTMDMDADDSSRDGFTLFFMNTLHGQVYATVSLSACFGCEYSGLTNLFQSERFSILASEPGNYTEPDLPVATVTATLDSGPNPTQQWALTLNGKDPDATASAQVVAGNVGAAT